MRCLVVGGTGFLGGAITDLLAAKGHEVVVLARGATGRSLPSDASMIQADRYGDLGELSRERFDWVFDTCAYTPGAVERLLDALDGDPARYVMVSSVSAYGMFRTPRMTEDEPVPDATEADHKVARGIAAEDRGSAIAYGASYGPLKRACEIAAMDRLGDRATIFRAGLLVGAGDYTDRLTWWVRRLDKATGARDQVPAPGPPDRPVQVIDVRDLARFALVCAEAERSGIFNVTGRPMAFADLLDAIQGVAEAGATIRWIPDAEIVAAGVAPWTDMPLMAPPDPEARYLLDISVDRAFAAGLTTRPLVETLAPLLAWDRERRETALTCGLSTDQERALLAPESG